MLKEQRAGAPINTCWLIQGNTALCTSLGLWLWLRCGGNLKHYDRWVEESWDGGEQKSISECPTPARPALGIMALSYSFLHSDLKADSPAYCSKASKTHLGSYKMIMKPHSLQQRCQYSRWHKGLIWPQAETGSEFHSRSSKSLQTLSYSAYGHLFLDEWGAGFSMEVWDLVGDRSHPMAFSSLLLSLGKEGGSLFCPSINFHLYDKDPQSPLLAWAPC